MADHIQRIHHKIHRHDIDAPTFQANRRHPWRQQLTQALDQLEEVIRSVNLVHLTGVAVTHHHRRTVNRPRHLALLAHDFFAFMFGHEIRVFVVFGFTEHVFPEHAFIQTGSGDRTHMVKVPGVDGLGQLDGVTGAIHIHLDLAGGVGSQVVNGGEVVNMVDRAFELFDGLCRHAQFFAGEVTKHRH